MKGKVKVGIIGSGFEADIHAAAFQIMPQEAEVGAVASPTPGNAEKLARQYDIPRHFLVEIDFTTNSVIDFEPESMAICEVGQKTVLTDQTTGPHIVADLPAEHRLEFIRQNRLLEFIYEMDFMRA